MATVNTARIWLSIHPDIDKRLDRVCKGLGGATGMRTTILRRAIKATIEVYERQFYTTGNWRGVSEAAVRDEISKTTVDGIFVDDVREEITNVTS